MEPNLVGPPVTGQAFRREMLQYYVTDLDPNGRPARAGQEKSAYVG
ncbi:hypothetical protein ACVIWV_004760 [Bradyrhizobium diazoefficiens]|jgi:hypothetical protein|nr:hypothetical protein [Bradyrhizobium japonicum]MBP1094467.1 hypothetical protein [Bradyrhizobium japonicum]